MASSAMNVDYHASSCWLHSIKYVLEQTRLKNTGISEDLSLYDVAPKYRSDPLGTGALNDIERIIKNFKLGNGSYWSSSKKHCGAHAMDEIRKLAKNSKTEKAWFLVAYERSDGTGHTIVATLTAGNEGVPTLYDPQEGGRASMMNGEEKLSCVYVFYLECVVLLNGKYVIVA